MFRTTAKSTIRRATVREANPHHVDVTGRARVVVDGDDRTDLGSGPAHAPEWSGLLSGAA